MNRPCRCGRGCRRRGGRGPRGLGDSRGGGRQVGRRGDLGVGLGVGGGGFGIGRLEPHRAGVSTAPMSACRRCRARAVWKPLEWAEMPRMAWMATGRPGMVAWRWPRKSVHSCAMTGGLSKAARAISAASAWMRGAGMPVTLGHGLGREGRREVAVGDVVEDRAVGDARMAVGGGQSGSTPSPSQGASLPVRRSMTCGLPCSSRRRRPFWGEAGSSLTRQGALVKRAR